LVLRWSNKTDVVVPFVTLGRRRSEAENIIGSFVYPLFLRVELRPRDTFLDLLRRVSREYGTVCEHDDYGRTAAEMYGKTAAEMPRAQIARNPFFNWFPRELHVQPSTLTAFIGDFDVAGLGDAIRLQPFNPEAVPLEEVPDDGKNDVEWDYELGLFLSDTQDAVAGALSFRPERVTARGIEEFARSLHLFAEILVTQPNTCVAAVSVRDSACAPRVRPSADVGQ
jgi:hypothetical protein